MKQKQGMLTLTIIRYNSEQHSSDMTKFPSRFLKLAVSGSEEKSMEKISYHYLQ